MTMTSELEYVTLPELRASKKYNYPCALYEGVCENRSITPRILNLNTRRRSRFTSLPLRDKEVLVIEYEVQWGP